VSFDQTLLARKLCRHALPQEFMYNPEALKAEAIKLSLLENGIWARRK